MVIGPIQALQSSTDPPRTRNMGAPHLDSELWIIRAKLEPPSTPAKNVIPTGSRKAAAEGSASLPLPQAQAINHSQS